MKNLIILATIVIASNFVSVNAFANKDNDTLNSPVSVQSPKPGVYNILYLSDEFENVKLNIRNEKGEYVHTDFFAKSKGLKYSVDLNNLPEGKYQINIRANRKRFNMEVEHAKEGEPFVKSHLAPEGENGKYNLTVVRHEMKPVIVTIYNKDKDVIYYEVIDVDYNFNKKYDLSKKYLHAESISVSSGNYYHEHDLK